jgi:hypothetical protein
MAKPKYFIFFFLFAINLLLSHPTLFEIKGGAFRPNSPTFREIYHDYQGECALELTQFVGKHMFAWGNIGYLITKGDSLGEGGDSHTGLQYIPFSTGIGGCIPLMKNIIDLHLGAGVIVAYLQVQNDSSFVIQHQSQINAGGIFKTKFLFHLPENFYVDLFADYSILKFPFSQPKNTNLVPQTADFSGILFGIGLGYEFGKNSPKSLY